MGGDDEGVVAAGEEEGAEDDGGDDDRDARDRDVRDHHRPYGRVILEVLAAQQGPGILEDPVRHDVRAPPSRRVRPCRPWNPLVPAGRVFRVYQAGPEDLVAPAGSCSGAGKELVGAGAGSGAAAAACRLHLVVRAPERLGAKADGETL